MPSSDDGVPMIAPSRGSWRWRIRRPRHHDVPGVVVDVVERALTDGSHEPLELGAVAHSPALSDAWPSIPTMRAPSVAVGVGRRTANCRLRRSSVRPPTIDAADSSHQPVSTRFPPHEQTSPVGLGHRRDHLDDQGRSAMSGFSRHMMLRSAVDRRGGVDGLWTAWPPDRCGPRDDDRHDEVGSGASWGNAAWVSPGSPSLTSPHAPGRVAGPVRIPSSLASRSARVPAVNCCSASPPARSGARIERSRPTCLSSSSLPSPLRCPARASTSGASSP